MDDVPVLVSHFIKKHSEINNRNSPAVNRETLNILTNYHWRGNVRELENVIERSGKIIARCPACAERGRDSQGNHLVIFDNGAYSCIVGDANHRKEIYRLARKALNTSKD